MVAVAVRSTADEAKTLLEGIESVNNNDMTMSRQLEELLEELH